MTKVCKRGRGACRGAIEGEWSREQCRLCWLILNPPETRSAAPARQLTQAEREGFRTMPGPGCCPELTLAVSVTMIETEFFPSVPFERISTMSKCKFVCNLATKRMLVQINPETKEQIKAYVFDAELSVAPNDPDNKGFFVAQHGGMLKFVACTMQFEAGQEYWLDISPAPAAPAPAEPEKPA